MVEPPLVPSADAPQRSGGTSPRVVIVGGGFSGAVTAANLLRAAHPLDVVLVERDDRPARGVAYGTVAPEHLLNVAVGSMSAFPDRPQDFLQWLRDRGEELPPHDFAKRSDYGRYLFERLQEAAVDAAASGGRLTVVHDEAIDVVRGDDGWRVTLRRGAPLHADRVVLALGHLRPADPLGAAGAALDATRYAADVWNPDALRGIPHGRPVLILGTGLTAVDVVLSLRRHGHRGKIVALSRRGLLPQVHRTVAPPQSRFDAAALARARPDLRALVRAVRAAAEADLEREGDWRGVVAALRPHTSALWQGLDARDRARFLRHVRPFWDTHRHRMAPAVADAVLTLLGTDVAEVHAGRVLRLGPTPQGVRAAWLPRGGSEEAVLEVARVLNATGTSGDLRTSPDALVRALVERGTVRPDPLGLGLATDREGRVLDAAGAPGPDLFALGSLRAGELWESTAVPELRVQARDVAARIVAGL